MILETRNCVQVLCTLLREICVIHTFCSKHGMRATTTILMIDSTKGTLLSKVDTEYVPTLCSCGFRAVGGRALSVNLKFNVVTAMGTL